MARPGTQRRFFAGAGKKDVSSSPTLQSVSGAGRLDFRWVARQPILNRARPVFWGCELLFRDVIENFFRETDAEQRPTVTLDSTLLMGCDYCAMDRGSSSNCARELRLKDGSTLVPPVRRWWRRSRMWNLTIW